MGEPASKHLEFQKSLKDYVDVADEEMALYGVHASKIDRPGV